MRPYFLAIAKTSFGFIIPQEVFFVYVCFYWFGSAKEWAEQLLYENCRRQDSITLQCVSLPFLNDINFKISYRNKTDEKVRTYIVKSISNDFAGNITTIQAMRFYNDQVTSYQEQLEIPIISTYSVVGREVTVEVTSVDHAESYVLYMDFKPIASSTGTTISFSVPNYVVGEHLLAICAEADGYSGSNYSEPVTINIEETQEGTEET